MSSNMQQCMYIKFCTELQKTGSKMYDMMKLLFKRSRDSHPRFEWFCNFKYRCIFIESDGHTRHASSNRMRWSDSWSMRCGERKLEINKLENSSGSAHFFLPGGCYEIWAWYVCQWSLSHGTPEHSAQLVLQFFRKTPHSMNVSTPYSTHMAPCDFFTGLLLSCLSHQQWTRVQTTVSEPCTAPSELMTSTK